MFVKVLPCKYVIYFIISKLRTQAGLFGNVSTSSGSNRAGGSGGGHNRGGGGGNSGGAGGKRGDIEVVENGADNKGAPIDGDDKENAQNPTKEILI